jgi:hypothetical protein
MMCIERWLRDLVHGGTASFGILHTIFFSYVYSHLLFFLFHSHFIIFLVDMCRSYRERFLQRGDDTATRAWTDVRRTLDASLPVNGLSDDPSVQDLAGGAIYRNKACPTRGLLSFVSPGCVCVLPCPCVCVCVCVRFLLVFSFLL